MLKLSFKFGVFSSAKQLHLIKLYLIFQVLNMKLDEDGKITKVTEVYSEEYSDAAGSSVAVYHGGSLVIGSKLASVVKCDMLQLYRKKRTMTMTF